MESMSPNQLPPSEATPEEIAQLEKSRTISDSNFLKDGAEYSINEKGGKSNLLTSQKYIESEKGPDISFVSFDQLPHAIAHGGFYAIRDYILNTHPSDFLPSIPRNFDDLPDELKDGEEYYFLGSLGTGKLGEKYIPGVTYFDKPGHNKRWIDLAGSLDFMDGHSGGSSGKKRFVIFQRKQQ